MFSAEVRKFPQKVNSVHGRETLNLGLVNILTGFIRLSIGIPRELSELRSPYTEIENTRLQNIVIIASVIYSLKNV